MSARETVEDLDDPRLDPVRDLITRRNPDAVVVEGFVAVQRALAGPMTVRRLVATGSQLARLDGSRLPASTLQVDTALMRQLVGFAFHRGVLAIVERPDPRPADLEERLAPGFTAVVLERLADPVNVGAIVRTAAALGVDLVVCAGGADPYSRRALRASMGHALRQPPWLVPSAADAIDTLADRGARILAATTAAHATDIDARRRQDGQAVALIVGNEGEGLSPETLARADAEVTIPIARGADSLNVAAAAAIALHALGRGSRPQGAT